MDVYPIKLTLAGSSELLIEWSDGQTRRYSFSELRNNCPCATCRERHKAEASKPAAMLPVLSLAEAQSLKITAMKPIGSYAYAIHFSDGHDTGIYTLEQLRELGRQMAA